MNPRSACSRRCTTTLLLLGASTPLLLDAAVTPVTAGPAASPQFLVNTTTAGAQYGASIAADADGDFVIAWTSYDQDGSLEGVYAQRYSAAGARRGA